MSSKIVWFEVVGQDADKMRAFYGKLFGWNFNVLPEIDYGLTACEETGIPGGVGKAQAGNGWNAFYVGVDDLDATLAMASDSGASVLQPPTTLPDGTYLAVIADPEGRPLGLVKNQAGTTT
ncbi:MAG: VOC family protein [Deltaproteobacteria bacterium]|nr:VOC family protein [Deltaproteobacteria bacterium]